MLEISSFTVAEYLEDTATAEPNLNVFGASKGVCKLKILPLLQNTQ